MIRVSVSGRGPLRRHGRCACFSLQEDQQQTDSGDASDAGTTCSGIQRLPHPKGWSKLMSQQPGRQVAVRACPDKNLEQICSGGAGLTK